MNDTTTTVVSTRKTFLGWNGDIPAWGLVLIGLAAVGYGVSWMRDVERTMWDLDKRLAAREQSSVQYRDKVDGLIKDQSRLVQVEVKLNRIETVLDRLERFLVPPNPPQLRP